MLAAIQSQYGDPHVLYVGQVECPKIGPREVPTRVHASCVTQGDRRLRAADFLPRGIPAASWAALPCKCALC